MNSALRIAFAASAFALTLAACQGGFGSGTAAPGVNPPVNPPAPGTLNQTAEPSPEGSPTASPGPGDVTYAFSEGPKGLACPQQNGFTCTLYLNMSDAQFAALMATPKPAPRASGAKNGATPSPTPTPTPTPSPAASPSGSASPSPTPASAQIKIALESLPKDAPSMVNPNPKAVATISLVTLRLTTTDDVTLAGHASLQFTLPKEQIGGRGFAIQLFHETLKKHNKRSDQFIGSYSESSLSGEHLVFSFTAPKIAVKKGDTWLFVLYGDELPSASPSPGSSGSPPASASPRSSSSPAPAASSSAAASAIPSPDADVTP